MCKILRKFIKKRFFMKPFIDKNKCPECGGKMKTTGITYATYPAQHEFKCEKCGKTIIKIDYDLTDNENNIVENIIEETTGDTLEEIIKED